MISTDKLMSCWSFGNSISTVTSQKPTVGVVSTRVTLDENISSGFAKPASKYLSAQIALHQQPNDLDVVQILQDRTDVVELVKNQTP